MTTVLLASAPLAVAEPGGASPAHAAAAVARSQHPYLAAPPAGAGQEYVEYQAPAAIHNRFLLGGLLVYAGGIFGGILLLARRRISALAIGGGGVTIGLALMLSRLI